MQSSPRRFQVTRLLLNGGEPSNMLFLFGNLSTDGRWIDLDTLLFEGEFDDGSMSCSITPLRDGTFRWRCDATEGTAPTFEDAWLELPGFLTDPDWYEQGVFEITPAATHPPIRP